MTSLRVFQHIDRMQPQYAGYWGLTGRGGLALTGMSQLLLELEPGNAVYPLMDRALKSAAVESAGHIVERDFGLMEIHSPSPAAVTDAGDAILQTLGVDASAALAPEIVSTQTITNITAYQSLLFNRIRRGEWTLPGDAVFVLEITPAAYVYRLANELEKAFDVELVRMAGTGIYGRMIVAGSEATIELVTDAITEAVEALTEKAPSRGGV